MTTKVAWIRNTFKDFRVFSHKLPRIRGTLIDEWPNDPDQVPIDPVIGKRRKDASAITPHTIPKCARKRGLRMAQPTRSRRSKSSTYSLRTTHGVRSLCKLTLNLDNKANHISFFFVRPQRYITTSKRLKPRKMNIYNESCYIQTMLGLESTAK